MKVLQLTKKFPYPLKDGESIAIYNLTKGLLNCGASIDLLSLNTSKHYTDTSKINGSMSHYASIDDVFHNNDVTYSGALLNLFSSESYHVQRLRSDDFKATLIQKLKTNTYDVIMLETIYMSMYVPIIKQYSNASICLRAHNIEYEIWKRCSCEESSKPKSWYYNVCAKRLKQFETKYFDDYALIASITDRDAESFKALGYTGKQVIVPVGLNMENYQSDQYKHQNKFCFIGSLDWMPNLQGLEWFVDKVWPNVIKIKPELQFHIAGRNAPQNHGFDKIPGVVFHGEVSSATDFIRDHGTFIVPLFSGSGIRVKILEAMAMQRPVITTDIGLEGISAINNKHVMIANTVEEYTNCLTNPAIDLESIASKGREYILQYFDRNRLAQNLYDSLREVISSQASQQVSDK